MRAAFTKMRTQRLPLRVPVPPRRKSRKSRRNVASRMGFRRDFRTIGGSPALSVAAVSQQCLGSASQCLNSFSQCIVPQQYFLSLSVCSVCSTVSAVSLSVCNVCSSPLLANTGDDKPISGDAYATLLRQGAKQGRSRHRDIPSRRLPRPPTLWLQRHL